MEKVLSEVGSSSSSSRVHLTHLHGIKVIRFVRRRIYSIKLKRVIGQELLKFYHLSLPFCMEKTLDSVSLHNLNRN